jgi:hypothetical protein
MHQLSLKPQAAQSHTLAVFLFTRLRRAARSHQRLGRLKLSIWSWLAAVVPMTRAAAAVLVDIVPASLGSQAVGVLPLKAN